MVSCIKDVPEQPKLLILSLIERFVMAIGVGVIELSFPVLSFAMWV